MNCFIIAVSQDKYIANVPQPLCISSYWNQELKLTEHSDMAKHYRTKAQANAWLKRSITRVNDLLESTQHKIDTNKKSGISHYRGRGSSIQIHKIVTTFATTLNTATVQAIDIKFPSFMVQLPVFNQFNKSYVEITTPTTSKYTCNSCGLITKNVPILLVDNRCLCGMCAVSLVSTLSGLVDKLSDDYKRIYKEQKFLAQI